VIVAAAAIAREEAARDSAISTDPAGAALQLAAQEEAKEDVAEQTAAEALYTEVPKVEAAEPA